MVHFQMQSELQFRAFSSEMVHFQMQNELQFRGFSSEMVNIEKQSEPQIHAISSEMVHFEMWRRSTETTRSAPFGFRKKRLCYTGAQSGSPKSMKSA